MVKNTTKAPVAPIKENKIITTSPILDLSGKPIKGSLDPEKGMEGFFTIGEAVSTMLVGAQEGGKMKLFILAQKFYNEPEIELDSADLSLVRGAVEKSTTYNALVIGQILVLLDSLKK
jgi:hypothetical protein